DAMPAGLECKRCPLRMAAASPDRSNAETVPAKPTGFTTEDGNTQVRLRWTGPADPTITAWQYAQALAPLSSGRPVSFGDWVDMPDSGAATRRYTVTGLTNNRTYKFRIRAVNATGAGPASDDRTADPYPAAPGKPEGFQAVSGNERADLTWKDADDVSIQGWEYRRKDSGDPFGHWLAVPGSHASTTRHTVTGLRNGTEYTFQIRAYNNSGNGYPSNEKSVTPMRTVPGKPGGLSADPGNRRITLSWTDPGDGTIVKWQYAYRTTGDYGDWTDMAGSGAGTVFHVVSMLENGMSYFFKIRAINDIGEGAESDEVSAVPMARTPERPTGLIALSGDGQVALSWNDPLDASITAWQYAYRVAGDYGDWTAIPGGDASTTDHTVDGLTNGTAYTFRIRALNEVGHGPESDEVSATALSVPAKPTGFTVAAGDARVVLGWDNALNATVTGWQYSFSTSGDFGRWIDIPDSNAATTGYTVAGLSNGAAHTFRIRAVNASGHGAESEGLTATPRPVPARPTGFRTEAGNTQIRLVWTDPGDGSISAWQYKVRTTGGYGGWTDIPGSGAATTRHTVTALTNDVTHTFRIRAVNGSGAGPESDEALATPRFSAPAKPTGFRAEAGDREVVLTWDDPDDSSIAGWQYKSRVSDGNYKPEWDNVPASDATTARHVVTGLENGRTYMFRIRAVNSANGYESDERSATPRSLRPAAPTGLRAEAGDERVTLTWDDPVDATITRWQYSAGTAADPGEWTDVPGSNAATTEFTLTGLENGTTYIFRLRAVNASGNGAESGEVTAVPFAAPPKPTGLTTTPGGGWVLLEWDDPNDPDITGWEYNRRRAGGEFPEDWTHIPGSNAATTTHKVTGLEIGASYGFKLRAAAGSRVGKESDEATAALPPVPARPQRLSATAGDGEVLLEWEPLGDPTVIFWQYSDGTTGGDVRWIDIPGSGAATTRQRVTGLVNGTDYGFRIRAVNSSGHGAASGEATAVPANLPEEPTGFTAAPGDGMVLLEWDKTNDPAVTGWEYNWRRSDGPFEEDWAHILGSSAATSRYAVIGLENGVSYAFKLRAVAGGRAGRESGVASARPTGGLPPVPESLRATPGDRQATLLWNDLRRPLVTGWQYRYRTTGAFSDWAFVPGAGPSTTRHTVTGLSNDVVHYFQIRAGSDSGFGPPSETANVSPEPARPGQPAGLKAEPGDGRVLLTWNRVNDSTLRWQYVRWVDDAGLCRDGHGAWVDVGDWTVTRYAVAGLANGTSYCFRIRAARGSDPGPGTDPVSATPQAAAKPLERKAAKAGLSSLAGRLAAGAEAVIGARFSASQTTPRLLLAGRDMPFFASPGEKGTQGRTAYERWPTAFGMNGRDALRDSAFHLPLGSSDGENTLQWSLWHRGELKVFQGSTGRQARFGGRLLSAWYGLDMRRSEHWLMGVAVARSKGEVEYAAGAASGLVKTTIDSVHPYLQRRSGDGRTFWLMLGGGRGTIENTASGRGAETADAKMATVSAGFRGTLPPLADLRFAASGAVGLARLESDGRAQTAIGSLAASTDRQSLDFEAALGGEEISGYTFLSLRRDGGDSVRGWGLAVLSGIRSPLPDFSGNLDIRTRWTGRHSDRDYREFGLTATVRRLAGANGSGPSWSLAALHGAPDDGGGTARPLWSEDMPEHGRSDAAPMLKLQAGWRFASRGMSFSPHAALVLAGAEARQLTLGIDMGPLPGPMLKLTAELSASDTGSPESRFSAALRFRF
ncbi:MAG: hypothetical protein F4Y03_11470, partial [Alphaproteobacteria bacterium]|nr:hypothetical protein [Alphaproteobacteria bacterium]